MLGLPDMTSMSDDTLVGVRRREDETQVLQI